MDECKRMGIAVLGPDINESERRFTVNKDGNVRFGMAGVKGVGGAIVDGIVEGRKESPYQDIFDFIERASKQGVVNKKTIESLVYAGGFDSFENIRRDQFFLPNSKNEIFIEALCRYGSKLQSDTLNNGNSLFGDTDEGFKPTPPDIPMPSPEYNKLEFLKKEKDYVGMYLSSHPLDMYKFEIKNFAQYSLTETLDLVSQASTDDSLHKKEIYIAGLVSNVSKKISQKSGKPWMSFSLEDYSGSINFSLFGRDYENFMQFIEEGNALFVKCAIMPRLYSKPADNDQEKKEENTPVECDLKIRKITLLANTKDEFIKSMTLVFPVEKVDKEFRKNLLKALKANKGKKQLNLNILDYTNQLAVEFFSRKYKIDVTPELLDFIEHENLEYKVEKEVYM